MHKAIVAVPGIDDWRNHSSSQQMGSGAKGESNKAD